MASTYNTLIISDLHLGEDLSPSATEANQLHIDIVERQLVEFLRHHARRREDGLPWRLIVNGDMVDFLAVCIFPEEGAAGADASMEDREFGYSRTVPVAVAKLDAVIVRHREVFRALARFASRGNRIEIISGNHDTEFHWPATQARFREGISAAWEGMPESRRPGAADAEWIAQRIRFHPWFFHEPGVLWVEHGHQYDECCSFSNYLEPRCPETDEIVTNVDTAGTRFITNYVREADPHSQESWSALGYLRFGMSLGVRGCLRLARGYLMFSATLLRVWRSGTKNSADRQDVRGEHELKLAALAEAKGLPTETLRALDELRRPPVVGNLHGLARVLMLDKVLIFAIAAALALLAFWFADGGTALLGAAAAGAAGHSLIWWSGRGRSIDSGSALMMTPARILRVVDAQYVVFGHTHEPVARQLESGGWYFNTGTWVPTGKPGLLRAFTHVVVRHRASGAEATLCQWRDGGSRAFTPGWVPAVAATADAAETVTAPDADAAGIEAA